MKRRKILAVLGSIGTVTVAGCSSGDEGEGESEDEDRDEDGTETEDKDRDGSESEDGDRDNNEESSDTREPFELGSVVWHTSGGNVEGTGSVNVAGISTGNPSSYQVETSYAPVFTENAVIHGTQISQKSTGEAIEQLPDVAGQSYFTPTVAGNQIYFPTGRQGGIVAVNGTTGAEVWRYSESNEPEQLVATTDAVVLFDADFGNERLIALSPSDGSELWSKSVDDEKYYLSIHDGRVYLRRGIYDVSDGTELEIEFEGEIDPRRYLRIGVAQDGSIYLPTSDRFIKFSRDGAIEWTLNTGRYTSKLVSDSSTLYAFADEDGQTVVALNADDGSERWSFPRPDRLTENSFLDFGDMAVSSEHLYISYRTQLHALDKESGEREFVYQHDLGDPTVAVGGGVVSLYDSSDGVAEILINQS